MDAGQCARCGRIDFASRHNVGSMSVSVDGSQRATGDCERGISFYGVNEGQSLDPAQARDLAAVLVEAADELDKLG